MSAILSLVPTPEAQAVAQDVWEACDAATLAEVARIEDMDKPPHFKRAFVRTTLEFARINDRNRAARMGGRKVMEIVR